MVNYSLGCAENILLVHEKNLCFEFSVSIQ